MLNTRHKPEIPDVEYFKVDIIHFYFISQCNSIESTAYIENCFLVVLKVKITKNNLQQIL